MPQSRGSPRRLNFALFALLALLACYQTYYCLRLQKTPGWDASMGFLTLRSSFQHGDFNRLHHPAIENLAEDRAEFIAWWTPGQYLIPHWTARALDLEVGTALRLASVVCSLGGLAGYYLLYTKLGFSRTVACLGLIVLCSQEYFLKVSRTYLGGDLLLFGIAPFLALGAVSVRIPPDRRALLVAAACFFAVFLKATAVVLFLALTVCLAFEILGWPGGRRPAGREWRRPVRHLLVVGGIFLFFVLLLDLAFLSRGVTISLVAGPLGAIPPERWWGLPVALAGPLYGAFSFLEPYGTRTFYLPMALLGLLAVWKLDPKFQDGQRHDYRRLLVAHYLAFVLFFSFAYLKGMGISYEARHSRYLGLLLLPGLIHWLLTFRRPALVAGAIAGLSLILVVRYDRQYRTGPLPPDSASRWGIRQPVTNASLEAMHRIDDTLVTDRTIIFNGFGACPALLLEFNRGRALQDDNMVNFGFKYTSRDTTPVPWYRKEAESIVLLVPKNNRWYFGASLQEIARTFERQLHVTPCFENEEIIIYQGSVR